jgi:hypothetical protein
LGNSTEIHELIYKTNAEQLEQVHLKYLTLTEAEKRGTSEKLKNDKLELESAKQNTLELKALKQKELTEFKNAEKLKLDSALTTQREIRRSQADAIKQSRYLPTGTGLTGGLMGQSVMLGTPQALTMQAKYEAGLISSTSKTSGLTNALQRNSQEFMHHLKSTGASTFGLLGLAEAEKKVIEESIKLGAREMDLESVFTGTREQVEMLKIASANTIDDSASMKMVQYGIAMGKTDEQMKLATAQARVLSRVTGEDLNETYTKIIKSSDGYVKSISSEFLSKTKYNELLKDEVKNLGGLTEEQKNANGETEVNIKNLSAQEQQLARTNAFNKLVAQTYGDVTKEKTASEQLETFKKIAEEAETGLGKGLIAGLSSLAKGLGIVSEDEKKTAETTEKIKHTFEDLGKVMVFMFTSGGPGGMLLRGLDALNNKFMEMTGLDVFMDKIHVAENRLLEFLNMKSASQSELNMTDEQLGLKTGLPDVAKDYINKLQKYKGSLPVSLDDLGAGHGEVYSRSGSKSGKTPLEEAKEILTKVQEQEKAEAELQKQLEINNADVGSRRDILQQILEIEREIFRLKTGERLDVNQFQSKTVPDVQDMILPGRRYNRKAAYGTSSDFKSIDEQREESAKKFQETLVNTFGGVLNESQQILSLFGDSKNEVAQIVQFLQSVLNAGQGVEGLIGDIIGLFPGGGLVGAALGGGGSLAHGAGMVHEPMINSGGMQPIINRVYLKGDANILKWKSDIDKTTEVITY